MVSSRRLCCVQRSRFRLESAVRLPVSGWLHTYTVYYTDKAHRQGAQKNTQDSALVKRANASRVPRVCQFSKLSTNEFRWIRLDSKHSNASIKREIRFTIFQSIERESALRRLGFVSPVTYKFSLGTKNVARLWS